MIISYTILLKNYNENINKLQREPIFINITIEFKFAGNWKIFAIYKIQNENKYNILIEERVIADKDYSYIGKLNIISPIIIVLSISLIIVFIKKRRGLCK